jgi:hypothetical protein
MDKAKIAPLSARIAPTGPKRVLSLDGGGVRGILATGILREIEEALRARSGRAEFRLCDYFDLIGGTSTGAIIAAGLAVGKSVDEMTELYQEMAPRVFRLTDANAGIRKPRFDAAKLENALFREFGDHELGSPAFRTGFAVFTKRLDTGSAWTLTNNPRSKHWNGPEGGLPNRSLLIRNLVLASAAAPSFFEERRIDLSPRDAPQRVTGEFVDGGVAALNDPSLQLLKVATMPSYGFGWQTGPDRLMMISVGTGYWRPAITQTQMEALPFYHLAPAAAKAVEALKAMIHDSSLQTLVTMQGLAQTPRPWRINSELGDMRGDALSPIPLLLFQRFDARLDDPAEMARLAIQCSQQELAAMTELASDDPAVLRRLYEIGRCAGRDYFNRAAGEPDWRRAIFPPRFDPPWFEGPPLAPPRSRLEAMARFRKS